MPKHCPRGFQNHLGRDWGPMWAERQEPKTTGYADGHGLVCTQWSVRSEEMCSQRFQKRHRRSTKRCYGKIPLGSTHRMVSDRASWITGCMRWLLSLGRWEMTRIWTVMAAAELEKGVATRGLGRDAQWLVADWRGAWRGEDRVRAGALTQRRWVFWGMRRKGRKLVSRVPICSGK